MRHACLMQRGPARDAIKVATEHAVIWNPADETGITATRL